MQPNACCRPLFLVVAVLFCEHRAFNKMVEAQRAGTPAWWATALLLYLRCACTCTAGAPCRARPPPPRALSWHVKKKMSHILG